MNRRAFIVGLGSAAAWSFVARAQKPKRVPHVGILLFDQQDRAVIRPCF
jgi:hypothetical protein